MIQYIVTKNINENKLTQDRFWTLAYCSFHSASFKEEGISDSEPMQNLRNLLFLVLHPPEEMPSSEDWLTQSLSRIISHEVHIPPYLQEVFLCHSLLCEMPILGEVLSDHHSESLPATTFLAFHSSELSSSPQVIPKLHAAHTSPPLQTSTIPNTSILSAPHLKQ